jgi:hypothetical protein
MSANPRQLVNFVLGQARFNVKKIHKYSSKLDTWGKQGTLELGQKAYFNQIL